MQPHQVFWEICNLTNYENISYSINVLIKLLGKYFISNYPSNQNFWEICNLIKFFEKYVISSSMIFRNVSICRSCKNCIVCFIKILFWTKWIQMIFDKMPNWMWIILQLSYLQNLTKKFKVHYNLRLNLILLCDVDHNMMHKSKKHNCIYLAAVSNCEQGDPKKCPITILLQKLPR